MSANNCLIVCKVNDSWCVFINGCVDNKFRKPKTTKEAMCVGKNFEEVLSWAHKHDFTEYGVIPLY